MALYMQNRRLVRRNKLIKYLGGFCTVCKSTTNLEFNHIDRSNKLFTLSGSGLDKSWVKILEEVDKCELVCHTCHLGKTREQFKTKQIRPWNDKKHLPFIHGTARSYNEINCRCNDCKKAKRLYRNKQLGYSDTIYIPQ